MFLLSKMGTRLRTDYIPINEEGAMGLQYIITITTTKKGDNISFSMSQLYSNGLDTRGSSKGG